MTETSGKRFKHRTESEMVMTQLMLPSHANFGGKVHGGYILELMDQIAFACASKHSGEYCVTASVNTVNFLAPVEVGELLTMKASINYVGNSSMVVGIRVESENVRDSSDVVKHCNSSYITMVALDEKGNKIQVPGLILKSDAEVRRFAMSLARMQAERDRAEEFREKNFSSEDFLQKILDCRVRIEE